MAAPARHVCIDTAATGRPRRHVRGSMTVAARARRYDRGGNTATACPHRLVHDGMTAPSVRPALLGRHIELTHLRRHDQNTTHPEVAEAWPPFPYPSSPSAIEEEDDEDCNSASRQGTRSPP
mgnify:CR=1 FL=1